MAEIKGVLGGCVNCEQFEYDGVDCYCTKNNINLAPLYEWCPYVKQSIFKRMLAKFTNYVMDKIYRYELMVDEKDKALYLSLFYPNKNSRLFFDFPESHKQLINYEDQRRCKWLFWIRNEYVQQWEVGMDGDSFEGRIIVMILPFIWLKFGYRC